MKTKSFFCLLFHMYGKYFVKFSNFLIIFMENLWSPQWRRIFNTLLYLFVIGCNSYIFARSKFGPVYAKWRDNSLEYCTGIQRDWLVFSGHCFLAEYLLYCYSWLGIILSDTNIQVSFFIFKLFFIQIPASAHIAEIS